MAIEEMVQTPWFAYEHEWLRSRFGQVELGVLAATLGRDEADVVAEAQKLGLADLASEGAGPHLAAVEASASSGKIARRSAKAAREPGRRRSRRPSTAAADASASSRLIKPWELFAQGLDASGAANGITFITRQLVPMSTTLLALLAFSRTSDGDVQWMAVAQHLEPLFGTAMTLEDVTLIAVRAYLEAMAEPRLALPYSHAGVVALVLSPMKMLPSSGGDVPMSREEAVVALHAGMLAYIVSVLRTARVEWMDESLPCQQGRRDDRQEPALKKRR